MTSDGRLVLALSLLLSGSNRIVDAAPADDAVPFLPGYGPPPTPHWSGYLDASKEEPGTMLHYWFAKAESLDADKMPITLWLNGGPGSSSILGMLQEMGPLLINATGGLMRNPYAWTKQTNLLILESPAGVGYSYCAAMKAGSQCNNTDVSTAKANRAAIQDFFATKFPEFRSNSFFITGESYAGVYVPTLTQEILLHAPEINMKGLAVGDPCTAQAFQAESMDMLWYAHKHGLVPDDDFDFLWNKCNHRYPHSLTRGQWLRQAGRWAPTPSLRRAKLKDSKLEAECTLRNRIFLATTSKGISQSWDNAYINELDLFADSAALDWELPGTLNYYNAQWMMRPDVKKALHVEGSPATSWPGPADGWEYHKSYDACSTAAPGAESMIEFYRRIAPKLATTIVFNGDVDPCVSYEGTRAAIEHVGFAVIPGGRYRPWFFNKKAASLKTLEEKPGLFGPNLALRDAGAQFGGHVVNYEHNLSFVTVHGSGHMVPQFRPQSAERLLNRLLSGEPFVQLLPTDAAISVLTDDEFNDMVDTWTVDSMHSVQAVDVLPELFVV